MQVKATLVDHIALFDVSSKEENEAGLFMVSAWRMEKIVEQKTSDEKGWGATAGWTKENETEEKKKTYEEKVLMIVMCKEITYSCVRYIFGAIT